jgi:hypothetical protein
MTGWIKGILEFLGEVMDGVKGGFLTCAENDKIETQTLLKKYCLFFYFR